MKKKTAERLLILSLMVLALTLVFIYAVQRLEPTIRLLAYRRAELAMSRLINLEVKQLAEEEKIDYAALIATEQTTNGRITGIHCDMEKVNSFKSLLTERLADGMENISPGELSVPLGNALGSVMTAGRGPDIPVKMLSAGSVKSHLENDFSSAGINQTRHRIMLYIEVNFTLIYPSGCEEVTVNDSVCLAETVIAGEIPRYFAS